jgi:hypothetical protein
MLGFIPFFMAGIIVFVLMRVFDSYLKDLIRDDPVLWEELGKPRFFMERIKGLPFFYDGESRRRLMWKLMFNVNLYPNGKKRAILMRRLQLAFIVLGFIYVYLMHVGI